MVPDPEYSDAQQLTVRPPHRKPLAIRPRPYKKAFCANWTAK
jgi:hypothetical protein